ncbi:unnamed protein product [Chondrus crispus]|uniref:Uncharacterized protein n=1 Tax=Chondrus crispus TaxID=2769 RepID=R7QIU1_CHOCR|nr:unnamed protein product [Chondrus crispus]CDF37678.1 unnamed protein product [Chondrus crispus]|eukprot:XP_005717549.1 unnamed protein product [Chondrus crispus]
MRKRSHMRPCVTDKSESQAGSTECESDDANSDDASTEGEWTNPTFGGQSLYSTIFPDFMEKEKTFCPSSPASWHLGTCLRTTTAPTVVKNMSHLSSHNDDEF